MGGGCREKNATHGNENEGRINQRVRKIQGYGENCSWAAFSNIVLKIIFCLVGRYEQGGGTGDFWSKRHCFGKP